MREGAEIASPLFLWTSIGFYGLLRHELLGPSWSWWCAAWLAMGCWVISKGVGFLPAMLLVPWAWLYGRGAVGLPRFRWPWAGRLAPLLLLLPVLAWLLPMLVLVLVAQRADPALVAYRDNILFQQTMPRYADAGHHYHWFGYYLVEVAPILWLPLTFLLPWTMWPFIRRLRHGDPVGPLQPCQLASLFGIPGGAGEYEPSVDQSTRGIAPARQDDQRAGAAAHAFCAKAVMKSARAWQPSVGMAL
jgi:hypothetical protein